MAMEHIRQAIERVRNPNLDQQQRRVISADRQTSRTLHDTHRNEADVAAPDRCTLIDAAHLEANRIVAHDDNDPRARNFQLLRTQVVQTMNAKAWRFLAVTSPTSGCGKSALAVNLALSVARQPDRSVVLVDLDLSKRRIANCFGLNCDKGLISTLAGRTTLPEAMSMVAIGNYRLLVLPSESAISNSSECLASRSMSSLLHQLKSLYRSSIVIFDIPPLLPGDDAISVLPHIDCSLLVIALGVSTLSEVKTCQKYLDATEVLRIVVNGAPEPRAIAG
jgi:protein-tyrosine kinase